MTHWGEDVMPARSAADSALHDNDVFGGRAEDEGDSTALGLALATRALCLELRAHAVALAFAVEQR